jgi:mRNA interferase MazF
MRAGSVITVDFGVPLGSEAGLRRPAVVVTADVLMAVQPRTFQVVPLTSNTERNLPFELLLDHPPLPKQSVAACHLVTTIAAGAVVDDAGAQVTSADLIRIREVLADILDLPM